MKMIVQKKPGRFLPRPDGIREKRIFPSVISVVLVLAMLLTGCTSPGTTTPSATNPQTPASAPTVPTVTDPTQTAPTDPGPTNPAPTDPAPTDPAPTDPAPTDPAPTDPEEIPVESITLSAPKTTIAVMEQLQITAAVLPENAAVLTVMYGSAGGQVLDNGIFFAEEPGVYVVTAYAMDNSGVSDSITIIVEAAPVTGIAITGANTAAAGETMQLQTVISPEYATDPSVTWSIISGGDFATIDQNGLLTAIAAGEVVVQAAANDGSGVTATHTVEITAVQSTSVTISGGKKVTVGDKLQLKAEVQSPNAGDPGVTWSIISGAEYATIDQNGLLTAIDPGNVTVQVVVNDGSGVKTTHKVEVQPVLVNKITISGASTVKVGKTIQLSAAVKPDNAANKAIKWSISKGSSYAKISDDGVLTGVAAGKVTVKATAQDGSGISATFTVTVEESGGTWDGSGTKSDPFLITCLEDLMNLQTVVKKSGYYFKQVADIDCSSVGNWIVIGDFDNPFRHHYDGGGYTIYNLCLDGEAQALFCVVEGSHFQNVNIVNAHTKDNHQTYENNTGKYAGNGGCTAALVGYGIGCSFKNCTATVNFQSSNNTTGGLIGFVVLKNEKYTLMEDCHVSGTITSNGYTGGLIARIWNYMADDEYSPSDTITVRNSSADVEIIVFTGSSESCIGGLIGESFGVRIEKCHAKGSINVIDGDIGGLVGNAGNYTDVVRCYAEVDIYASSDNHYGGVSAGGLIGHIYSRSDVYDCYATGNITAPYVKWSPCQDNSPYNGGPWRRYYNPCGSLIGTLEVFRAYSEDQKITVYNCYATGTVDVPNICEDERVYCHGALIGLVLDRYTYSNVIDKNKTDQSSWDGFSENYIGHFGNNYNLEDLRTYYSPLNDYKGSNTNGMQNPKYTAMPTHDYVQIITKAQLLEQSIFEGWDFENVWVMTSNGPRLR